MLQTTPSLACDTIEESSGAAAAALTFMSIFVALIVVDAIMTAIALYGTMRASSMRL
jgi:hypothetical protein